MKKMDKVSVIIPVYNCVSYLPICLDSIVLQSYKNIEIICIDDGSKDGSSAILDEYAGMDHRFVVIHQNNSGVSSARNKAISIMTGNYVMFVDADDWLDSDAIEETLKFTKDNRLDICSFSYVSERGNIHHKKELFSKSIVLDETATQNLARRIIGPIGEELKHPLMLDSYGTIWAKLYKATLIDGLQFEDLKEIGSAEDSLFNMFVYRRASRTGYLHKFSYHYRKNNVYSETKKYRPKLQEKWKKQYEIIRSVFSDSESLEALSNRIAINHYGLTSNLMLSENPQGLIKKVFKDPVYSKARYSLQTKYMVPFWRFFFVLVKQERVYLIILFHRLVTLIMKVFVKL